MTSTPPTEQQLDDDREQEIRTLDLAPLMSDRSASVISGHLAVLLGEVDRLRALPELLEQVLTERFTDTGNPYARMVVHEEAPDGWPATHAVSPVKVAEVLRELIRPAVPAAVETGE